MEITTRETAPPPPAFTPFEVVIRVGSVEEARALKLISLARHKDIAIGPWAARSADISAVTDHILDTLHEALDKRKINAFRSPCR